MLDDHPVVIGRGVRVVRRGARDRLDDRQARPDLDLECAFLGDLTPHRVYDALARLEADARAQLRQLEEEALPGGADHAKRFGEWYGERKRSILEAAPKGYDRERLVARMPGRIRLTGRGMRFLESVVDRLLG